MSATKAADNADDGENHIVHEPLVQLDLVDVVTNEEDEDILWQHRAKIYHFVMEDEYGGEKREKFWKQRGLGDLKILKHKETGECRVLMRQEKTLKMCANFKIVPDYAITLQGKNAVLTVYDFATDEENYVQIAVKFKTAEITATFKNEFEAAQAGAPAPSESKSREAGESKSDAAAADGAAESTGSEDTAQIDAEIAKYQQTVDRRRKSVAAQNALQDSDYDSDEEDVDEGNTAQLKERYNVASPSAEATVDELASKVADLSVKQGGEQ